MSKLIKLTEECIKDICSDFEAAMRNMKMSDGKVSYTKNFGVVDRKATLFFSELAYFKMITLVREFDKEVAWHGVAFRGEDPDKDEYIIRDIIVYPQEVTGATVNTDQKRYETWLMSHDDEVFNNIRMQGHSHVNMGTSPSSVDTSLYDRILDQLDDTMFYIFLIWNKKGERTIKIYDLAKNIQFETSDITVKTLDEGLGIANFLKDAKEMVQEKSYTWQANKEAAAKTTEVAKTAQGDNKEKAKKEFDTSTKRYALNKPKSYGYYDYDDRYGYGESGYYNNYWSR